MERTPEDFLQLLEPIYPRLARYSFAVTRDKEAAADLTSDTVLAALEQFESMKSLDNFAGYLFTIASRLHKRRRFRERFKVAYTASYAEARIDSSPSPDQAAEIAIVMMALETLPPKIRETVVLFDVADLSLEEIRVIQGGSLSGVKSRLTRGREMLKQTLGISAVTKKNTMKTFGPPDTNFSSGESYAI